MVYSGVIGGHDPGRETGRGPNVDAPELGPGADETQSYPPVNTVTVEAGFPGPCCQLMCRWFPRPWLGYPS